MKIGLVCPYDIFRAGGVQECVRALQKEMVKRGHEATILTPLSREARGATTQGVIFLGGGTEVKSPFHTTAQVSASANIEALRTILNQEKFDILHFHEPWVPILSRQLLGQSKSINIATFHTRLPDTVMSRTIERVITPYTKSILKYLDALTAVSKPASQYVKTLTHKNITIIPNGIDLSKYKPKKSSHKSGKTILYIGRLERRKGIRYLLEAFGLLAGSRPALQLIIAGDGPDRQKLEAYVKENKIPRVRFMGYVDEQQKLDLLNTADLFCSPAIFGESFGIVLLEAMAASLVVLAGNNPGYISVMEGRGAISIINPKEINEFARRMDLFLNDNEIRQLWIKWANEHVKQYDYHNVASQYENLYKESLA